MTFPCAGKSIIAARLKSGASNLQGFKNGAVNSERERAERGIAGVIIEGGAPVSHAVLAITGKRHYATGCSSISRDSRLFAFPNNQFMLKL
jgi:hypothetical protein